jgi:5'-3' exonuclease
MYRARYSGMNKGEYSAIFNFFRGLRPLIEKFNPDKTYFVLEGMPVKRLKADPEYKGQRVYNNKDNFSEQRKEIVRILNNYFPIQIVKHDDYECDDIIGFFANKFKNENVTIISSDTDFIQCINENVTLYNPVRKKNLEKPDYDYVLWKSLKGDASDNIVGFKGVGDKKAMNLCENKNLLESFLDTEEKKEKLEHNKFMIKLHDIKSDSGFTYYSTPLGCDWDNLKEEFTNMEFNSIVSKEKSWEKFKNTFKKLEIEGQYLCQQ